VRRGKQIAGKRILLVDDVITSGATLSECVRQLRLAGAAEVVCVTLARKHSDCLAFGGFLQQSAKKYRFNSLHFHSIELQ
jgi:orotate phosphoribosyltransferase